ncbi:MBOAT-domain-containing protein [Vararia minispora EC-137]|uniref:MBOAT-domain-containing protein n=1 Tax=Vararia minispora EC-137 TaxID=1314806 RepID=A0ACB8QWE1_9AGAM|nr:MBOAT-domain-containing protein [Vararia minispora EC-137]
MDALFSPVAVAVGAPVEQVKLLFCLLVSYPLGSIFIRVPGKTLKHVFNITVALFYVIPVLNLYDGFLQLLVDVLVTYYVAKTVKGRRMPWMVFWLNMGHLTVNHVLRVVLGREDEPFDLTAPQMVLVMKLTTFAWNVYDGQQLDSELDTWQTKMRVKQYPALLEFLGYAFYFPGFLVGPFLEFNAYTSLVDGSLFKVTAKSGTSTAAPLSRKGRAIPDGRKRVAYRKGAIALVYLVTFILMVGSYHPSAMLTTSFLKKPLWSRVLFLQLCQFIARCKYYGIWQLTEGAAILTGFGFSGFGPDGESLWAGAANIDVFNVELAPNFKVLLDSWNMKTNQWLRECIYKRVTAKGKKPGFRSSMLTFATSAFWHGIAPGYYITFVLGGFVTTAARLVRQYIRPLVIPVPPSIQPGSKAKPPPLTPLKRAYDVLGTSVTFLVLNFVSAPFLLLSARNSVEVWARVDYYGLWMVFATLAFFYSGGRTWLKSLQARRVRNIEHAIEKEECDPSVALPPVDQAINEVRQEVEDLVQEIEKKLQ